MRSQNVFQKEQVWGIWPDESWRISLSVLCLSFQSFIDRRSTQLRNLEEKWCLEKRIKNIWLVRCLVCEAMKKKGQGHVRPKNLWANSFYRGYKYPSSLSLVHLLRSVAVSRSSSPQTLALPLLLRRRWGRASLPRPRRRRTRAGCGFLHSAAVVAVLYRVRAWKIWTDELHCFTSLFVVFFRVIKSYFYCPLWFKWFLENLQKCFSSYLHTLNTSQVICSWFVSLSIIFLQDSSIVWIFDLYNSGT